MNCNEFKYPRWPAGWIGGVALMGGLLLGSIALGQETPAQETKPEAAEEPSVEEMREAAEEKAAEEMAKEEAAQDAGINLMVAKLVPEGEPSKNVTIPNFKEGVLNSIVKAESITRVDDENLETVGMEIQIFNEQGEIDVTIQMHTSGYHMPTGLLESDTRTSIKGSAFDLSGDRLIYDTRTQQGKLLGNVKMYVYNMGSDEEDTEEENK